MKITHLLGSLGIICLLFSSCTKNELIYSCDPKVNEWAQENVEDIRNLDRQGWLEISNTAYQKAAYVAFTPNQKLNLWINKLDECLSLDWTDREREHISELKKYIKNYPVIFEKGSKDDLMIFAYKWTEFAKENLGWSNKLVYGILMDASHMLDKEGNLRLNNDNIPVRIAMASESGGSNSCNCRTSSWINACDIIGHNCIAGLNNCQRVDSCGPFWTSTCDGRCNP